MKVSVNYDGAIVMESERLDAGILDTGLSESEAWQNAVSRIYA